LLVKNPTSGAPKIAAETFSKTSHMETIWALSLGFLVKSAQIGRIAADGGHDAKT
jgi:hypothetical protein